MSRPNTVAAVAVLAACDKREAATSAPASWELKGNFGTHGFVPSKEPDPPAILVADEAIRALRSEARGRFELARDGYAPSGPVVVTLGGEGRHGLQVAVEYDGKVVRRNVVPADFEGELLTNFDHTLQSAFDEAQIPRK